MAGEEPLDQGVALVLGALAVADLDLDLAAAQTGRHLERLEVHPLADLAQRLGDLRLRDPE